VQSHDLDAKRLSILREALPSARHFAFLAKRPPRHLESVREVERVARTLNLQVSVFHSDVRAEHASSFEAMRAAGVEGIVIAASPDFVDEAADLARLAAAARLPTIGEASIMARAGLLIGYGPDRLEFRRRTTDYVVRILRGEPPGNLPIQQPTVFEFAINLKVAKSLGLTLPQPVLIRADEVIE
jgi:putative ABC transport system substrate-binding protein